MKKIETITFALPIDIGKEIQKIAQEEHLSVSDLITETFKQFKAQRILKSMAEEGREIVKQKGLTPEDFGGPFEE